MRRATWVWVVLAVAILVPLALAATSPLLAWREPVYIAAGLAGVVGLALLLCQPLLAAGVLPGLTPRRSRQWHRAVGALLVLVVAVHLIGLWITSPPDVIDALLLVSPTPFSLWGVIALWALLASAVCVALRHRVRTRVWRLVHKGLGAVVVAGTVVHAVLIEGTMEMVSKMVLCALVVVVSAAVLSGVVRRR